MEAFRERARSILRELEPLAAERPDLEASLAAARASWTRSKGLRPITWPQGATDGIYSPKVLVPCVDEPSPGLVRREPQCRAFLPCCPPGGGS